MTLINDVPRKLGGGTRNNLTADVNHAPFLLNERCLLFGPQASIFIGLAPGSMCILKCGNVPDFFQILLSACSLAEPSVIVCLFEGRVAMELEVETLLSRRPAVEANDTTALSSEQQKQLDRHKVRASAPPYSPSLSSSLAISAPRILCSMYRARARVRVR